MLKIRGGRTTYKVGHIARSAGDVDDLNVLIELEREELVDEGLGIAVSHDVLAGVKVLQVLDRKGLHDFPQNIVKQKSIVKCLKRSHAEKPRLFRSLTVGQWSKSFVRYAVLFVDPKMYIIMKFWMLKCLPPFSSWNETFDN